ncbi:MAG: hypothetical protein QOG94_3031 [Solirubrobacteraceae bacterium]|nr:hypothetical protein [Solirubrobacteraceae bacterium]
MADAQDLLIGVLWSATRDCVHGDFDGDPRPQLARRAVAADSGLQRRKDPPCSVSKIPPSGIFLRVQLLDDAGAAQSSALADVRALRSREFRPAADTGAGCSYRGRQMPRGRSWATYSFIEIVREALKDGRLQPDLGVNERPWAGARLVERPDLPEARCLQHRDDSGIVGEAAELAFGGFRPVEIGVTQGAAPTAAARTRHVAGGHHKCPHNSGGRLRAHALLELQAGRHQLESLGAIGGGALQAVPSGKPAGQLPRPRRAPPRDPPHGARRSSPAQPDARARDRLRAGIGARVRAARLAMTGRCSADSGSIRIGRVGMGYARRRLAAPTVAVHQRVRAACPRWTSALARALPRHGVGAGLRAGRVFGDVPVRCSPSRSWASQVASSRRPRDGRATRSERHRSARLLRASTTRTPTSARAAHAIKAKIRMDKVIAAPSSSESAAVFGLHRRLVKPA